MVVSQLLPAGSLESAPPLKQTVEKLRYVKPVRGRFVLETEITIARNTQGTNYTSVTRRGMRQLTVHSRFDKKRRLVDAQVTLKTDSGTQTASAKARGKTVSIKKQDGAIVEFKCPPGVIVTSAPDWTDAILCTRAFDNRKGKTQQFAGLWIHPTRQPLRLTFTLTLDGTQRLRNQGTPQDVERFTLTLRGGSRYVVWRNQQRQLVRLAPSKTPSQAIFLAGWERASFKLTRSEP